MVCRKGRLVVYGACASSLYEVYVESYNGGGGGVLVFCWT